MRQGGAYDNNSTPLPTAKRMQVLGKEETKRQKNQPPSFPETELISKSVHSLLPLALCKQIVNNYITLEHSHGDITFFNINIYQNGTRPNILKLIPRSTWRKNKGAFRNTSTHPALLLHVRAALSFALTAGNRSWQDTTVLFNSQCCRRKAMPSQMFTREQMWNKNLYKLQMQPSILLLSLQREPTQAHWTESLLS